MLPLTIKLSSVRIFQYYYQKYCGIKIKYCDDEQEMLRICALLILQLPAIVFVLSQTKKFSIVCKDILFAVSSLKKLAFKNKFKLNITDFKYRNQQWKVFQNKKSLWELFQFDLQQVYNVISNQKLFFSFVKEAISKKPLVLFKEIQFVSFPILKKLNNKKQSEIIFANVKVLAQRSQNHANNALEHARRAKAFVCLFDVLF